MANEKQDVNAFISAYSDSFAYSLDNRLILNWYPERILLKRSGGSLLELGIGHGFSTSRLSSHFQPHIVIDASSDVIRLFRKNHSDLDCRIVEAYFEDYQPDRKFDVILMGFVLEHVEDPELILNKYKKYLAPGGVIFAAVPNYESLHRRIGHAAGVLKDMAELGQGDLELGHRRAFNMATLRELFDRCGFIERSMEGLFMKPFSTRQLLNLDLGDDILHGMMVVGKNYPELCTAIMIEVEPGS